MSCFRSGGGGGSTAENKPGPGPSPSPAENNRVPESSQLWWVVRLKRKVWGSVLESGGGSFYLSKKKRGEVGFWIVVRDLYTIVELRPNLSFEKKKKTFADLGKKFLAFFVELGC